MPELLSGTCSGTYDRVSSSYILSTNYPQNYGRGDDCRWTITHFDQGTIRLNVHDFETDYKSDIFSVYNGTNDEGNRLKVLSGSLTDTRYLILNSEMWFSGKFLYLKFTTNLYSQGDKGFNISVQIFGKYQIVFIG